MPHIDEGTLHAYLDGALDLYPAGEAEGVRSHLESCGECRARLEEERAIRDEARAILASAAPDVSAPPFEELRAEAARRGTPAQRRGLSGVNRWAWAASVVLALGTGWMLRGSIGQWLSQPVPQEQMARPSVAQPAEADGASAQQNEVRVPGEEPVQVPEEQTATGAAEMPPPPVPEEADEAMPAAFDDTPAAAQTDPAAKVVEDQPAVAADPAPPSALPAEEEEVREGAAGAARRMESVRSTVDFSVEARFAARGLPTVAALEAPGAEEAYAFLPGLTVVGTSRVAEGSIRIRQLTEVGDTLDVIHLPPGVEPPLLSFPAGDGINEVVVFRGDSWIVVRGPLSEDDLLVFARRIPFGG